MTKHRPWEVEEDNYLIRNYGLKPIEEICAHLGRSQHAVTSHAAFRNIRSAKPKVSTPISSAPVKEPEVRKYPPAPMGYKRHQYDPTPCMERDLGYVG